MKKIVIYIAGSVRKDANDANSIFASDDVKKELSEAIDDFEVVIFDPNESKILGGDTDSRFGKDCLQVLSSDFLVADLREKRGLGVGAEMMLAKDKRIPVISVCPAGSHYQRPIVFHEGTVSPEWIHPFVRSLSDAIVNDFRAAGEWIKHFIAEPTNPKSEDIVAASIKEYMDNFFATDLDFKEQYLDSSVNRWEFK
ncbi:MAG: hypothetical protein NTX66_02055 [Candidatus Falkowbacteria bacterium]|nr:hypothetical protein [Candidatus Falkowbacteria bacterium]